MGGRMSEWFYGCLYLIFIEDNCHQEPTFRPPGALQHQALQGSMFCITVYLSIPGVFTVSSA